MQKNAAGTACGVFLSSEMEAYSTLGAAMAIPGSLKSVVLAQVREQAVRRLLDDVEHTLEAVLAAVGGIGHFALRALWCVLQKQAEFVLKAGRANGLQVGKILPIHGEDILEPLDVGARRAPPTPAAEIDTAP